MWSSCVINPHEWSQDDDHAVIHNVPTFVLTTDGISGQQTDWERALRWYFRADNGLDTLTILNRPGRPVGWRSVVKPRHSVPHMPREVT
jgi:hypothetical protein